MKPLNRDFGWMLFWLIFTLLQSINLYLKTVENNEQRFSRFMIVVWIVLALGMAISRFVRWKKAIRKMAEHTAGNE